MRQINHNKQIDSIYLEEKLKSLQKQVDEFKSRSNNSCKKNNHSDTNFDSISIHDEEDSKADLQNKDQDQLRANINSNHNNIN